MNSISIQAANATPRHKGTMRLAVCIGIGIVLGACFQATEPEWARSFDAVAQQFEQIRQADAEESNGIPPEARATYENMQMAWNRMNQMHSTMMQSMRGRDMMGRHGMGSAMFDASTMMQFREMNQQMLSYSLGMQQVMGRSGHRGMADMYGQMADRMQALLSRLPPSAGAAPTAPEEPRSGADGAAVYSNYCASCHGAEGQGLTGAFPPLDESAIASGPKDIPIGIVLHGLEGPLTVAGQRYDGVMPAFGATLSDAEIAAALTFVRSLPDNEAGTVTPADVSIRRSTTASHSDAFTVGELGLE
jgi:mono/diheme cytochrome c family protein